METRAGLDKLVLASYRSWKWTQPNRHLSKNALQRIKRRSGLAVENTSIGSMLVSLHCASAEESTVKILGTKSGPTVAKIMLVTNTDWAKFTPALVPNLGISSIWSDKLL